MVVDALTRRRQGVRRAAASAPEAELMPTRPAAVQLRARRNPRLIVIGVLCACLGALGMGWAWQGARQTQTVILVSRDVARGELIEAGDLTVTTLGPAPGVLTVPAEQLDGLIGQQARVDLSAGVLLAPAAVGPESMAVDRARVGLLLAAGQLPSQSLRPGSPVLLVAIPAAGPTETAVGQFHQFEASVVSAPQALSDGQRWLVDVEVAEHEAAEVAALAAAERIALVRKADG